MKYISFSFLFFAFIYSNIYSDDSLSTWKITASVIDKSNYYGVTVANGMIGLVSSPHPLKVKEVILNGVFDNYGRGKVSNILKGFNFMNVEIDVDGIDIDYYNINDFKQTLNMKHGEFITEFKYQKKLDIKSKLVALRHLPYTSLRVVTLKALEDIDIGVRNIIEAPLLLKDIKNSYSEIDRPHVLISLFGSSAKSPTEKHTISVTCSFVFEDNDNPFIIHEDWDQVRHLAKFRKKLKKGEEYTFGIVGSVCTTEHYDDPINESARLTIYAALQGYESLLEHHYNSWNRLWQSDIIIKGDDDVQRDVRSAIYHLYSFTREGTSYSLSPMGLSGLGYNGHVFWDTELWMYPPILMLKPDIALSILDYRYERLDQARDNSFSHGYSGAMFPWESDDTGQESTPIWALTGPFEHHISGCISHAFWSYYQVTQDRKWLKKKGFICH